jgi:hypothetical protein
MIVLNYSRQVLGQTGDGHFSPIGGYHAAKDMVLLMDVARFKYPPHWVKLDLIYEAMKKIDVSINMPRGFVILKENDHAIGPSQIKEELEKKEEEVAAIETIVSIGFSNRRSINRRRKKPEEECHVMSISDTTTTTSNSNNNGDNNSNLCYSAMAVANAKAKRNKISTATKEP